MNFFGRSQTNRAVHSAIREANGLWKRAKRSGAQGLSEAGDRAEDAWSEAKSHAVDAWHDAKAEAEQRFNDVLENAERSFKKSSAPRWDRIARKPVTALVVIGAAVGLAVLLSSLRRPDADGY